jgi:hypothetical protein
MEENKFEKTTYKWMETCASEDCFTTQHAGIFGYVIKYLGELRGNENKKEVARGVKSVVEHYSPQYLNGLSKSYITGIGNDFQILIDDLLALSDT